MSALHLYIATSLDGFIADAAGGVDWLTPFDRDGEDYGMADFLADIDTLVMGRATYAQMLGFGPWPYGDKKTRVLTRHRLPPPPEGADIAALNVPTATAAEQLKALAARDIWIVGGGQVASDFAAADLIDHYHLFLIPVRLGAGIRLFDSRADAAAARLALEDVRRYQTGVVGLRYRRVDRPANRLNVCDKQ